MALEYGQTWWAGHLDQLDRLRLGDRRQRDPQLDTELEAAAVDRDQ
ncbi:hypothetical protein [Streptomyces sp. NPDC048436]